MRRYDLRIAAPYADVSAALETILADDENALDETSPLLHGSFGLREDGDTTHVLLLVDDEDGLAGYRLTLALRELGFHAEEPTQVEEGALDPLPETVDDVLPAIEPEVVAPVQVVEPVQVAEPVQPEAPEPV